MDLNSLLKSVEIDPADVLVLRHRPTEPEFRRVLPWLAADKPALYNAYQQTQGPRVESAMRRAKYVASFIGHQTARALFVGIYQNEGNRLLTRADCDALPSQRELRSLGMRVDPVDRRSLLWFDLDPTDLLAPWKGKLIAGWPPPERSWYRWAGRNEFPVIAIREESALDASMDPWDQLVLTCQQLGALPESWRAVLREWRGIYFIFDTSDGKGYVGSAYGKDNILGRWEGHAKSGGGAKLLRPRNPSNFRFTVLQRVSPDLAPEAVIHHENSWKERLHTREYGLNEN